MSNYATIQLKDALARVEGVGDVAVFGAQDYSMRVWLDPDKLQSRNLTAGDVIRVLREQNVQVAAGQIGQPPVPTGQDFQYTLSTLGRLVEAEQFADIILKTGTDGEVTYLKDVARTELGARSQDMLVRLDGQPSAGLGIFQLPGSNALDIADRVKATMRELATTLPQGTRLRRHLRHHAVHPRVRERGVPYAARRGDPGRHRRAAVPAGLEGIAPAADRRGRLADRHLRRDEPAGLHPQ